MKDRVELFEEALYALPNRVTELHPVHPRHQDIVIALQESGLRPAILFATGVNKAGKSPIEQLVPLERRQGMSATCAKEVADRWNAIGANERVTWLKDAPGQFYHEYLAHGRVQVNDLDADSWPEDDTENRDRAYECKDALGTFFTEVLRQMRDPALGGDAHSVIRRSVEAVLRGGVIGGGRTPPDFHFMFCYLLPYIDFHMVYVDAEQRRADKIRGHTERELMAIVPLVREHFPDHITVIDNNGSEADFLAQVVEHRPRLEAFLRV